MSRESLLTAAAKRCSWLLLCVSAWCVLTGCDDRSRRSSTAELTQFEAIEATGPSIDMDRVLQAKITTGPYHTTIGDVLQLEMPRILNLHSFDGTTTEGRETYACRISDDGAIMLPVVGPFVAAGRSLAEIEAAILAQYYPKYIKSPFPVYASILQYNTRRVSIVGAVAQPGVYSLRPDQMSLVALLMEAGGIVQRGAALIRIARRDAAVSLAPDAQNSTGLRTADGSSFALRAQTATAEQTSIARDTSFQATFEWEGPLKTTGWLGVADQNGILLRRWLDLVSDSQRSAFIEALTATPAQALADDLQEKVTRLAKALDSSPLEGEVAAVAQDGGWKADNGRLVISLGTPAIQKRIPTGLGVALRSADLAGEKAVTTLVLPVKGLNIPFADVVLREGDTVVVEWPREQFISVVGLVRNPGNFPYPQSAQYNLIQAIGFAGGLDAVSDPHFVSVYRLGPDGRITTVTVQLVNPRNPSDLTDALALPVKPGDVVSVEHTLRTRTNVFFDRFFRITFGLYADPRDLWDNGN